MRSSGQSPFLPHVKLEQREEKSAGNFWCFVAAILYVGKLKRIYIHHIHNLID